MPRFLPEVSRSRSRSPAFYNVDEGGTSKFKRQNKQSFSKLPKRTFVDRIVSEKKKVPAVGVYELGRADRYLTIGVRRSYK